RLAVQVWSSRTVDEGRFDHRVQRPHGPRCSGRRLAMPYEIKPLSCDPKKLKGLSEKLIVSHHENNYAGAVKRLNAIVAQFATLDVTTAPVFVINGLKREELIATNSMILHELYFDGLGDGGEPDRALRDALTHDFGSVDRWRAEFAAMGKAMGGGSGWVLLTYSPRDRKLVNQWAADHSQPRRRYANPRPRHVRTLLSDGLRRGGSQVRRCVHGEHPVEPRGGTVQGTAVGQVRKPLRRSPHHELLEPYRRDCCCRAQLRSVDREGPVGLGVGGRRTGAREGGTTAARRCFSHRHAADRFEGEGAGRRRESRLRTW